MLENMGKDNYNVKDDERLGQFSIKADHEDDKSLHAEQSDLKVDTDSSDRFETTEDKGKYRKPSDRKNILQRFNNASKGKKIALICVLSVIDIVLIFGIGVYVQSVSFLNEINNDDGTKSIMSVWVMNSTGMTYLEDTKDGPYGIVDAQDENNMGLMIKELKSYFGPLNIKKYKNLEAVSDALYKGEIKAAIINEVYLPIVEESHPGWNDEVHKVWSFEIPKDYDFSKRDIDVTSDSFNIFLCGVDTRGDISNTSLSDVNMILTVNPVTDTVLMTSIPRDYYVELGSYEGQKDKLTHTGSLGIDETVKTVEKLTGLKMDYYVKVNFAALVYVVDAIGGIDIESDTDFIPWTNRSLHIKKGMNHMDGVTALAYARERYAYEDGDIHRNANQRQVLQAVSWKAMSPAIILKYNKVLKALSRGMETNMPEEDIMALIKMQLSKKAEWDIRGNQIDGTTGMAHAFYTVSYDKLSVVWPDEQSVENAVSEIAKVMEGVQ